MNVFFLCVPTALQCTGVNQFLCSDRSACIPQEYFCDGFNHCRDASDELSPSCKSILLITPSLPPSLPLHFAYNSLLSKNGFFFHNIFQTIKLSTTCMYVFIPCKKMYVGPCTSTVTRSGTTGGSKLITSLCRSVNLFFFWNRVRKTTIA